MIHLFLKLIISELNDYLESVSQGEGPFTVAGNVGLASVFGGNGSYMENKVVASLINLAEEPTLKNKSQYKTNSISWEKSFPTVYLNAFILFSANFNSSSPNSGSENNYTSGIERLSQVIGFFQGKSSFKVSSFPTLNFAINDANSDPDLLEFQNCEFKLDMVSLTFEQCNHLWGSLGGKQLPFILYKAQVIPITRRNVIDGGGVIKEIETRLNNLSDT